MTRNRIPTHMIEENGRKLNEILAEKVKQIQNISVSVTDFGAKGDGVTSDALPFQNALNYLDGVGGGTLLVPSGGVYVIDSTITMISNVRVIISKGATIFNKLNYSCMFYYPSHSMGYDGGLQNIIFEGGGTFKGDFAGINGLGTIHGLHHTKNFTMRDLTFYQCMEAGHIVDCAGSSNILIENCNFIGLKLRSDRAYAEVIQPDFSVYTSLSYASETERANCDGTGAKNITVRNCRFLPIYNSDGSIQFYAPKPLGTHTVVQDSYLQNIRFIDNECVDIIPDTLSTTDTDLTRGMITLPLVDGCWIEGNTFTTTTPTLMKRAFGSTPTRYPIDKTQVKANTVITVELALTNILASKNIFIRRNVFKNYRPTGSLLFPFIYVMGYDDTNGRAKNIRIESNSFIDCFDISTIETSDGSGSDLISCSYVDDILVKDNYVNGAKRLLFTSGNGNVSVIGNILNNIAFVPITCDTTKPNTNFTAIGNIANNFRAPFMQMRALNLVFINNTCIDNLVALTATGYTGYLINFRSEKILVTNNVITTTKSVNDGVWVSTITNATGYIKDNIITGYAVNKINNSNTGVDSTTNK